MLGQCKATKLLLLDSFLQEMMPAIVTAYEMRAYRISSAVAFVLLILVYLFSTSQIHKQSIKHPLYREDLQPKSLPELKNEMLKGASLQKGKLNVHISKEVETTWSLPKIMHFIWIGSVIGKNYIKNINLFSVHNPEYQVILWLEKNYTHQLLSGRVEHRDVTPLISSMEREGISTTSTIIKADILRYQIVLKFGGIYIDVDSVSLRPLKHHLRNSFVAYTLQPYNAIQNSIFGFPKASRFLKFVMEAVRASFAEGNQATFSFFGPPFFTTMFIQFGDPHVMMINQDYLVNPGEKSNLIIQTNDCNWNC